MKFPPEIASASKPRRRRRLAVMAEFAAFGVVIGLLLFVLHQLWSCGSLGPSP